MKRVLSQYKGKRITVYARVDKFGQRLNPKAGCYVPTVCLQAVTNANNKLLVASHVWLDFSDKLKDLQLVNGDLITFSGVVKPYVRSAKGFGNEGDLTDPSKRIDYNFFEIQDISKVREEYNGEKTYQAGYDTTLQVLSN